MTLTAEPQASSLSAGIIRPLTVALWTYAAGYVPWLAVRFGSPIPAWVMPVVGIAAGTIGMRLARTEWSERVFDPRLPQWGSVLATVTGAAMAGWFYYAATATPVHAAMWLVLGSLPLGGWYWALHRSAVRQEAQMIADWRPTQFGVPLEPSDPEWTRVLEAAGFPGVHVRAVETQAGATLTVRPNESKPATADDMIGKAKQIATRAAFARPDIELREDDVRVEPAPSLPNILVHVSWKRPLRGVLPYVSAEAPRSTTEPGAIGMSEVGSVIATRAHAQNGNIVGATDGGKSVVSNVNIARNTECSDALVWVAATEKLIPLIYPWLRPWLIGLSDRPVLDWVAGQRPREVLDMLADLYYVMKMRNARNSRKSKHAPTRQSPAIILYIEEATDLARRKDKVRTFDGQVWNASQLLDRICALDRSSSISVYFLCQAALVDALGDRGSEIMRNVNLRICGRTNSPYDGQATLPSLRGNVDTTRLRDNTMLLQSHLEDPRVMPWKAYYLEDDHLIEPVAIRNAGWRPDGIEPEIAAEMRSYAGRWDDGRLPDLVRECEAEGFAWPGTRGAAPADADDEESPTMTAARTVADFDAAIDTTETIETINTKTAELRARLLPPPLDVIADLLDAANAPAEFVSTAKLAIVLGRVAPDAADADVERAAWALGREISAAVPSLKSRRRNAGGGSKVSGYDVPRLREVVTAIRSGEAVPEPEEESA